METQNASGSWPFRAQFPAIFELSPPNFLPMGIETNAENSRISRIPSTFESTAIFADTCANSRTPGNLNYDCKWPFFAQFPAIF